MEIEKKILEYLKKNSRYTNEFIAKELGVSEGTIRNKIKKLVEQGNIKNFTIKTIEEASAICMIKTKVNKKTSTIINNLKKINKINEIYEVSGECTIICKIEGLSLNEVNEIVEKIRIVDGVNDTETHIILNEII